MPCSIAFLLGNVFPLQTSMDDVMIEREVWDFTFYVYVCSVCEFIQRQRRCKLRVTDRDQAGTDLINRYLSLM